jgi:hypothetical protein
MRPPPALLSVRVYESGGAFSFWELAQHVGNRSSLPGPSSDAVIGAMSRPT